MVRYIHSSAPNIPSKSGAVKGWIKRDRRGQENFPHPGLTGASRSAIVTAPLGANGSFRLEVLQGTRNFGQQGGMYGKRSSVEAAAQASASRHRDLRFAGRVSARQRCYAQRDEHVGGRMVVSPRFLSSRLVSSRLVEVTAVAGAFAQLLTSRREGSALHFEPWAPGEGVQGPF